MQQERLIGHKKGRPGKTLIIFGGMHGNEPAGVKALISVFRQCEELGIPIWGEFIGLIGNTRAFSENKRYIDEDLNRLWTENRIRKIRSESLQSTEENEAKELLTFLDPIIQNKKDKSLFIDLHSYGAEQGSPFCVLGDILENRTFARNFPLPTILGLEEQIDGAFLEYANRKGHLTLGFEGGNHHTAEAIQNCEAIIWLALVATGIVLKKDIPDIDGHVNQLRCAGTGISHFYEVRYRHYVRDRSRFVMNPGYKNFQPIANNEYLANDHGKRVHATESGLMLLPLYQRLGNDGYFIIKKVNPLWLLLSFILRKMKCDHIFPHLPGVLQIDVEGKTYRVSRKYPEGLAVKVAHLLGYRRRNWTGEDLVVKKR